MTKKNSKEKVKEQVIELTSFVSQIQKCGNILRENIVFEAQSEINKIESDTYIAKVEMEEKFKSQLNKLEEIEKVIKHEV